MRGQSMVEAVVAVGVVVLLVTGLIAATTSSLQFGQMSKTRTQALQYAKEGMEVIRILRDTAWVTVPQAGSYCLDKEQKELGTAASEDCPMTIDNMFSRTVSFSHDNRCVSPSCVIVTVTVAWMEKGKQSVVLPSYMTDWRSQ